jgi:hypothetical protein
MIPHVNRIILNLIFMDLYFFPEIHQNVGIIPQYPLPPPGPPRPPLAFTIDRKG